MLAASSHEVTEREQVQAVLVGLSVFDSVMTLATFSPMQLSLKQVVEALLECKSRQCRFVSSSPLIVNLVHRLPTAHLEEQRLSSSTGGGSASRGHGGWSSRGRLQCQICNRVGHSA